MKREFRMEIEGLWVKIFYDYEAGDLGDYATPPTGPRVTIDHWELDRGEEKKQQENELSDDDWDAWMFDIEEYVYNDSEWDIIEWEESVKDEY